MIHKLQVGVKSETQPIRLCEKKSYMPFVTSWELLCQRSDGFCGDDNLTFMELENANG